VNYSGIQNIGLLFCSNISLANVKGEKVDGYKEKITLAFGEQGPAGEGHTYDWFHWDAQLRVGFGFIEGVDLALNVGTLLGVNTDTYSKDGNSGKTTTTDNSLRVTLSADYAVGAVSFGVGLVLQIDSKAVDYTFTPSGGSASTFKGNYDIVKFGIPIIASVAF